MTETQKDDMVLDVKNLQTVFFTNSTTFRSASAAARRWRSSANPAAARA
jgi:hypothetical protein